MSDGNANRISTEVTRMFQVKIGIRNMRMPGARIGEDRDHEVDAPRTLEMPTSASPTIHRSIPRPAPQVGSLSGA